MSSSIIFVLETRTIQKLKNFIEKKIYPLSDGEKKCFSLSPTTRPMGHLVRVGFGHKKLFSNFYYLIRIGHEKCSEMCV